MGGGARMDFVLYFHESHGINLIQNCLVGIENDHLKLN